jgi:hypothetical protein
MPLSRLEHPHAVSQTAVLTLGQAYEYFVLKKGALFVPDPG